MAKDIQKWLQVRMTAEEKELLDSLARDYRLDTSAFVRAVFRYMDENRPVLEITPEGKDLAPIEFQLT